MNQFDFKREQGKSMLDLIKVAEAFRESIQDAIQAGDINEVNLRSFPQNCCAYASNMLQRYLAEHGIETWYMSGQYGNGWNAENHAWLETSDGTVIDITGDQYKNKKPRFSIPVYVGPRNDGFHDRFQLDEPVKYQKNDDYFGVNQKEEKRYCAVIKQLSTRL